MKRLATLLLVGATIIGAQTATQTQDMEKVATQLQQKLSVALQNAGADVEKARTAAMECQKQVKGKTDVEAAKIMEARKVQAQEKLQTAIQSLERTSEQCAAQVDQAKEQIQSRLEAKKQELQQLQDRIKLQDGSGAAEKKGPGSLK